MTVMAVQVTSGKVHVVVMEEVGYGVAVIRDTKCGRHLTNYSYPVDFGAVTTKQVCHICRRHLPPE